MRCWGDTRDKKNDGFWFGVVCVANVNFDSKVEEKVGEVRAKYSGSLLVVSNDTGIVCEDVGEGFRVIEHGAVMAPFFDPHRDERQKEKVA